MKTELEYKALQKQKEYSAKMKEIINQTEKEIYIDFDKNAKKLLVKETPNKIIVDMSDNTTTSINVIEVDDYDANRGGIKATVYNGTLLYPVIKSPSQNTFEYCSADFVDGCVKKYQIVPLFEGKVIDSLPKLNNWIINNIENSWENVNELQPLYISQTFSWGKIRVICEYVKDEQIYLKRVEEIILEID